MGKPLDNIHPWKKGYKPNAAMCPRCFSGDVIYTGEVTEEEKAHIYHCNACNADFAAPTFYAICGADNSTLEKDHFYTPCIHGRCGKMVPIQPGNPRCLHFKPAQASDLDRKVINAIEGKSVRTRPAAQQPESDVTPGGINTELERARQERLRKMRDEK